MFKSTEKAKTVFVGPTRIIQPARIIQVQPVQLWLRPQPILRQALEKSSEKPGAVQKTRDAEKARPRKKKAAKSPTEASDAIQLFPAGVNVSDGVEYSSDLLASLSNTSLPNLTSSQLSSLLSEIDHPLPQSRSTPVQRRTSELKEKTLPASDDVGLEKCGSGEDTYFRCVSCEYLCLSTEKGLSHLERCPGRPNKISCIACDNSFKSTAVLKAHLLIDHDVSVDEHPTFISLNLKNVPSSQEVSLLTTSTSSETRTEEMTSQKVAEVIETATIVLEDDLDIGPEDGVVTLTTPDSVQKDTITLPQVPSLSLLDTVEKFLAENSCDKNELSKKGPEEEKEKEETAASKRPVKIEKPKIRCSLEGCVAKLSSPLNMEYHRACHSGEGWKCPECKTTSLSSWASLTVHLWRRHAIDMDLYACDQCSYKTNSLSKLMNLHRRTHGTERPFICEICEKGFKTKKQLRNHKSIQHRGKEKPKEPGKGVDCGTCGRGFSCARLLRQHANSVHRRLRPYLCPDCGHAAASRSSLRMHARQHTGEKPYSCPDCDFSTPDHNTLRRHKMRHSGTKPYVCPHCPYASIQSSTYKAHLKNKHPGLDEGLMYSCEVCPFRTVRRDNFLAHASHHALRPLDGEYGNLSLLRSPGNVGGDV